MAMISIQYESTVRCPVCGTGYNIGSYEIEAVHLHNRYKLCAECTKDTAVVARIEATEQRFREMDVLPSWWRRVWLPWVEYCAVKVIRSERREKAEAAAAVRARCAFLHE